MKTMKKVHSLIARMFGFPPSYDHKKEVGSGFVVQASSGLKVRAYENYEQYLKHQGSKLIDRMDSVKSYDIEYEGIVEERYRDRGPWEAASILCLAARLGGEVRAFKSLGALAVGIDIEPGPSNNYVLPGDFHNLQFADEVFDYSFSNAVDHVYDLPRFIAEIKRVLKVNGVLILEVSTSPPGKYEVIHTATGCEEILGCFLQNGFSLMTKEPICNNTDFVKWDGVLVMLQKTSELESR